MYLSDGKAQNIAKVCETENGKLLLKLKFFRPKNSDIYKIVSRILKVHYLYKSTFRYSKEQRFLSECRRPTTFYIRIPYSSGKFKFCYEFY